MTDAANAPATAAGRRMLEVDVDVLARAIERTPSFGRDRDYAERLAAEYARLMRERQP